MWHWAAKLPGDAPALLQLELKNTSHSGWDYVTDSLPGQEGEELLQATLIFPVFLHGRYWELFSALAMN